MELAIARTSTFKRNRKTYLRSTPTITGISRIWAAFERTDIGDREDCFGARAYAVDITDGPVITNEAWAAKARMIHTIDQIAVELDSRGASAYGGVDKVTGRASGEPRFRFNGPGTRASGVVHCVGLFGYSEGGYDKGTGHGDEVPWSSDQWYGWHELPVVVHVDIADDLTCNTIIETPVRGLCDWQFNYWHALEGTGFGSVFPDRPRPPELIYTEEGDGAVSTPTTTVMIDYVDDTEKRLRVTETGSYSHRRSGSSWDGGSVYDITWHHEVDYTIGRHRLIEEVTDHRAQGSASRWHFGGYKNVRYLWLAVDIRYDFYAALRLTYTTDNPEQDPMQPALSALQTWELVINGKVIKSSEAYAEWFDFGLTASDEFTLPTQPYQVEWDMGGPYNYIGSNFSAFSMFSATRGTYTHHGRSSIRPLRRGMFRGNTYVHRPEEISASTTGICPRVDIIPRVVIATDVSTGSPKPGTLFVTYAAETKLRVGFGVVRGWPRHRRSAQVDRVVRRCGR